MQISDEAIEADPMHHHEDALVEALNRIIEDEGGLNLNLPEERRFLAHRLAKDFYITAPYRSQS
jgi:hypothetical protein